MAPAAPALMGTTTALVVAAAMVLANGFFVAVEFSFVAARRTRLAEAAEGGSRSARRALEVKRELQFVLSAAQLGITVTSLVVGFVAHDALADLLGSPLGAAGLDDDTARAVGLAIGFALATVAQMVVGELAPKNLAVARPERLAAALAWPTRIYTRAAAPLTWVLDRAASAVVRRLGGRVDLDEHQVVSPDELDRIVSDSARRGELTATQADLLSRTLQFDSRTAGAVMVPWNKVHRVRADASCAELVEALAGGHTRFPLYERGSHVTGVVHAKDLLAVDDTALASTLAGELRRDLLAVPETCTARHVLAAMRQHSSELVLVVDEWGGPAGVVTLEDLLEELVGEIDDEFDTSGHPDQVAHDDGSVSVPATWRLDEVARATGVELPRGPGYTTVAGLVLQRLQRLARPGDRVRAGDHDLVVEAVDHHAVATVRLLPATPAATPTTHGPRPGATATPAPPAASTAPPRDGPR